MTKYYIKISDEEPLQSDESIWFSLEAVENGEDQFWIIRETEYNTLKGRVDQAVEKFTNSPDTIGAVQTVINSQGFEPLSCVQSKKIVDEDDDSLSFDYDSIKTIDTLSRYAYDEVDKKVNLTDIDDEIMNNSSHPVQNSVIYSALSDKVDLDSFWNVMITKSDTTHTHFVWTHKKINNYCDIWYNIPLKLCFFAYSRADVSFTKGKSYSLDLSGLEDFTPYVNVNLAISNPNLSARLTTSGELKLYSVLTGTMSIICSGMYIYV